MIRGIKAAKSIARKLICIIVLKYSLVSQIYIKKVYDDILSFKALIFCIFAPQNLDINELRCG